MSNTFSHTKCWNFGKSIPTEWKGTWDDMLKEKEWHEFVEKYSLTDTQIFYIKRGFDGMSMEVEDSNELYGNELMPFGGPKGFKGIRLCDVPDRYIVWLCKQDWLEKWPTVCLYARAKNEELNRTKLSKEEIADLLKI